MFHVFEKINRRWCRRNTVPLSHIRNRKWWLSPSSKGGAAAGSAPV